MLVVLCCHGSGESFMIAVVEVEAALNGEVTTAAVTLFNLHPSHLLLPVAIQCTNSFNLVSGLITHSKRNRRDNTFHLYLAEHFFTTIHRFSLPGKHRGQNAELFFYSASSICCMC